MSPVSTQPLADLASRLARMVGEVTGHTSAAILSRLRTEDIVVARWLVMWMLKQLRPTLSSSQIAAAVGVRNHSTVRHGLARLKDILPARPDLREITAAILTEVRADDPLAFKVQVRTADRGWRTVRTADDLLALFPREIEWINEPRTAAEQALALAVERACAALGCFAADSPAALRHVAALNSLATSKVKE